jgi:hypothetical protein
MRELQKENTRLKSDISRLQERINKGEQSFEALRVSLLATHR